MDVLSSGYRTLKHFLPQRLMRMLRAQAEAWLDVPWAKKHYAQFGEDAVLQSILSQRAWHRETERGEKGTTGEIDSNGFYVDIGAFSPKQYSNSYWFYRHGWHGVNIDATPGSMALFRKVRPRDCNVEAAVSDRNEDVTFYRWGTPAVINTMSAAHAEEWRTLTGKEPEALTLRTQRLEEILDACVPPGTPIDFFSVDVEGHTLQVLASNNWEKYRPSFVIVEIDESDVRRMQGDPVTSFLQDQGYTLRAWIPPGAIFGCDRVPAGAPEP